MKPSTSGTDWELLNALADGALGREEVAVLRSRIEKDSSLAAEFNQILALKSSLRQLRPAPRANSSDCAGGRVASKRYTMAAASIVLILCIAFVVAAATLQGTDEETVAEIHRAFSNETYILNSSRELILSSGAGIGALNVPDLTPSNLTLVDVRIFRNDAGERVAMHYRGRRGCRLTLIADALSMPTEGFINGVDLVYEWSTSKAHFVLAANGMDAGRFAAIGAFAEAASRLSEEKEQMRIALRVRTAEAKPCA